MGKHKRKKINAILVNTPPKIRCIKASFGDKKEAKKFFQVPFCNAPIKKLKNWKLRKVLII